ncbi:histone-lysine N-methyltransferase EHMT1-like [Haliotis asinina]|uniref:histone-lysine N-methyltransferase EHMT1-like n=1 Tax=Haliotis asinina TaxID=109174 RepID=UPI0035325929
MNPELTTVTLYLTSVVFCVSGTCNLGTYGQNCERNCSQYCASEVDENVHCERSSGRCSEGCVPGWYGHQCIQPCSSNCNNRTCNQQTGHCTLGCIDNYSGYHCEKENRDVQKRLTRQTPSSGTNSNVAAIVTPVSIVIIIIIIIIITGAVVWLRKHGYIRRAHGTDEERIGLDDLEWASVSTRLGDPDQQAVGNHGGETRLVDTDLHAACNRGNLAQVKDILSQGHVDIDSKGSDGMTAVMLAANWGHRDIFNTIMDRNPDASVLDLQGNNILHLACYGGDVTIVKCVLSHKMADINSRNHLGQTPVMRAALCGHLELFSLLLLHQPDMTLNDTVGNNILHWACRGGNIAIVTKSLSKNIDINSRGHDEKTPAMMAAEMGRVRVFELLKRKGADLSLKDRFSNDAYQLARLHGHMIEDEPPPRPTTWPGPCRVM